MERLPEVAASTLHATIRCQTLYTAYTTDDDGRQTMPKCFFLRPDSAIAVLQGDCRRRRDVEVRPLVVCGGPIPLAPVEVQSLQHDGSPYWRQRLRCHPSTGIPGPHTAHDVVMHRRYSRLEQRTRRNLTGAARSCVTGCTRGSHVAHGSAEVMRLRRSDPSASGSCKAPLPMKVRSLHRRGNHPYRHRRSRCQPSTRISGSNPHDLLSSRTTRDNNRKLARIILRKPSHILPFLVGSRGFLSYDSEGAARCRGRVVREVRFLSLGGGRTPPSPAQCRFLSTAALEVSFLDPGSLVQTQTRTSLHHHHHHVYIAHTSMSTRTLGHQSINETLHAKSRRTKHMSQRFAPDPAAAVRGAVSLWVWGGPTRSHLVTTVLYRRRRLRYHPLARDPRFTSGRNLKTSTCRTEIVEEPKTKLEVHRSGRILWSLHEGASLIVGRAPRSDPLRVLEVQSLLYVPRWSRPYRQWRSRWHPSTRGLWSYQDACRTHAYLVDHLATSKIIVECRNLSNVEPPVECRTLSNVETSRLTQSRSPPAYTGSRGCCRGLFQEQVVRGGPTPLHLRLRWTVFIYGGARGYIPRRGVSGACQDKFQTPLPLSNLLVVVVVESPRRVVVESRRCRCRSSSLSNVAVECRCRRRILKPKIELEMQCPRYSPHLMVAVVRGGSPAACRGPTPRSCAMLWRPTPPVTSKVQLLHRGHGSIGETLSATAHRGAIPRPWNIWPISGSNDMSDVWQGPFALDGVTLTSRIGVLPCVVVLLAGLSCC